MCTYGFVYLLLMNLIRVLSSYPHFHSIQPSLLPIPPTCIPLYPPCHPLSRIFDTPLISAVSRASIWYQTRYTSYKSWEFLIFGFWVGVWGGLRTSDTRCSNSCIDKRRYRFRLSVIWPLRVSWTLLECFWRRLTHSLDRVWD